MVSEAMTDAPQAIAEMPKYRCHKVVWALKIKGLEEAAASNSESVGGLWMMPSESGYGRVLLGAEYVRKHKPVVGGYYVVYKDGYMSFSPAKAFEEGYTKA